MALVKNTVLVLQAREYKETSQIIKVFSKELGPISLIAKGIKRKKSTGFSHFEFFSSVTVEFYHSHKSELFTLKESTVLQRYSDISGKLINYGTALLVCELIMKSSHGEDGAGEIYQLLEQVFGYLNENELSSESSFYMLSRFIIQLSSIFGIPFNGVGCAECGMLLNAKGVVASVERGGILCSDCEHHYTDENRILVDALVKINNKAGFNNISCGLLERAEQFLLRYFQEYGGLTSSHLKSKEYLDSLRTY